MVTWGKQALQHLAAGLTRKSATASSSDRRPATSLALLAALLGLTVVGCSSTDMLTSQSLSTDPQAPSETTSSASAFASSKPKAAAQGFNPFSDSHTTTDTSPRQVIASPTMAEVMLTGPLPEMAWGKADAPVTLIKYASLTCPFCRRFQREIYPQLKRDYIDTGKLRFIIREFPIGRSSGNATIALRCAGPSKYLQLYSKFLEQQGNWVSQEVRIDKIHAVAAQVGLSREKFDACLKNQEMIDGLKWVKDRGRTLGIIGTPNFFIQNERVKKYLSYDELRARIDAASAGTLASATAPAGR